MAGSRANWKRYRFGEVSCPMALYTAASSSEWIAVNTLNRKTGNRVNREFIDSETGDPVEREDQVKGYEVENGRYVVTSGRVTRRSGLRSRSTAPYSLATSRARSPSVSHRPEDALRLLSRSSRDARPSRQSLKPRQNVNYY